MKKIIIYILTIIFINANISFVYGEPAPLSSTIQSKNYRFHRDTSINGVFGTHTFFFNADKNWTLKDCYFDLVLSQSNLIDESHSTLTILVNNSPIYSIFLSEKRKYKDILRVNIPLDKVNSGFNEIKIKTYRRISDKPCTDDVNSSNWILFHKESYVHLDFLNKDDSNTLNSFPYPYLKIGEDTPVKSVLMIPDNFKDREATAALMLSSFFGNYLKSDNLELEIRKTSEFTNKDSENIIYIGSSDNTPKEILDKLSEADKNSVKNGAVIKKILSPYNDTNTMVLIIGDIDSEVLKAIYALCKEDITMQLKSSSIAINKNFEISQSPDLDKENISLKSLGYDNILLEGSFRQQAVFNLNIPSNKSLKDTAKIFFKIRCSQNLNFEKSLMSIYINDIPIGSKKLSSTNADDNSFEVKIPTELKDISSYEIKAAFDLYVKDEYCNFRNDKTPWAYISNESYLNLPYDNKKDLLLDYYPNPFIINSTYSNLTIMLPDKPTSNDISLAGNICVFLGHNLFDIRNIKVVKATEWSKEKNSNIIVLGTGENNSFIKELNNNLFIKFSKDFKNFESNKELSLMKPYSENLCSIQLLSSPYDKTKTIMVATGTTDTSLYNGAKYLYTSNFIGKLKGNGVTIDEDGNIKSAYFGIKYKDLNQQQNKESFLKNISNSQQIQYFLLFTLSTLVFLGVASVFIIKKYKK